MVPYNDEKKKGEGGGLEAGRFKKKIGRNRLLAALVVTVANKITPCALVQYK